MENDYAEKVKALAILVEARATMPIYFLN